MKPPQRIRISPHTWRLRRCPVDVDGELHGALQERELRILVARGHAPSQLRDTVLHEVLHAIWAQCGLEFEHDDQERVVASMSPRLLACLRDNPELVAFLTA